MIIISLRNTIAVQNIPLYMYCDIMHLGRIIINKIRNGRLLLAVQFQSILIEA